MFAVAFGHSHDHAVEQLGRSLEQVQMAVRDGIETSRINRRAHETHFTRFPTDDEQETALLIMATTA
jgi:hypothetical protein